MRDHLLLAAGVASALWTGAAALAVHERRAALRVEDEPPLAPGPLVSVVVPARDEERGIGAAIRSLRALDYGNVQVIVVDDQSRDGTLAAARAAADGDPRVRVVEGRPLPPGWIGKPWACWQAMALAEGEWLLFTDADVIHAPDSLGRALALARRLDRGGVTLMPVIESRGLAERAVTPAAVVAISTLVAPGPLVRSPRSRVALAAGGYMLMPRALYDRIGGHAAIRGRMVDDITLAARAKRAGAPLRPAPGSRLARLRMYHGAREVWAGWSKNASFGAAGGPARALAGAAALAALAVAPPAAAAVGLRRGDPALAATGLAGSAALVALQRLAAPYAPTPTRYAPTLPVGLLVLAGATARGALGRLRGAGAAWRGRRYPLAR